jgi:hypothetical protein
MEDEEIKMPVVTDSPVFIWLNYGEIEENCTHDEARAHEDSVTWCDAKIDSSDVKYVRADIHEAALSQSALDIQTLKDESESLKRTVVVAYEKLEAADNYLAEKSAELEALRGQDKGAATLHLQALVDALRNSFISSWQSTAGWQTELDAASDYLALHAEEVKA